jgi:glycosyltransferase A (GT-A) superfamily protein (DUF2064 family)
MKILGMTVVLLLAVNASGADRVQAGLWETTLTGAAPKPTVTKYCITAADAAWMNGDLATLRKHLQESTAEKSRGRCSVKNVELKANRSIVTTACGKVEMVSTTTYFGDRYEATNSNGTTLSGKRVGACPSK